MNGSSLICLFVILSSLDTSCCSVFRSSFLILLVLIVSPYSLLNANWPNRIKMQIRYGTRQFPRFSFLLPFSCLCFSAFLLDTSASSCSVAFDLLFDLLFLFIIFEFESVCSISVSLSYMFSLSDVISQMLMFSSSLWISLNLPLFNSFQIFLKSLEKADRMRVCSLVLCFV